MAERVHAMEQVVTSVSAAIARAAYYILCNANCCRRDLAIDLGTFAWLCMENLSLRPGLTRKLAAKCAGPFKVIE